MESPFLIYFGIRKNVKALQRGNGKLNRETCPPRSKVSLATTKQSYPSKRGDASDLKRFCPLREKPKGIICEEWEYSPLRGRPAAPAALLEALLHQWAVVTVGGSSLFGVAFAPYAKSEE
jgi:hypothetical protein